MGAVRTGKGFTVFISNEDMDDFVKIVESLKKSRLLIDGASETVKHEIQKSRSWISSCYDGTYGSFIDSTYGFFIDTACAFVFDKCYNWKRSHENRERVRKRILTVISITFNYESSGKKSHKSIRIIWINHMDKNF